MTIRKLEKKTVDEIIERGGEVTADKADKKRWITFNLRIREDLLEEIDHVLEDRLGISKTGWILEAIQEKLKDIR